MNLPIGASFYGRGKLLLTAEYLILDGAEGLAVPTKKGQRMDIRLKEEDSSRIDWNSYDQKGDQWFSASFAIPELEIIRQTDMQTAKRLRQLLQAIENQKAGIWAGSSGWQVDTHLEFDRKWGFGSSSTLVHTLAEWTMTDPFQILKDTFGGSGYDLACANADGPLLYRLDYNGQPVITSVDYHPDFSAQLFLVYLGKKMNSRSGISAYRKVNRNVEKAVEKATLLTNRFLEADNIEELELVIDEHESLISKITGKTRVGQDLFNWWGGKVKSLGAWGGDFVLVTDPHIDPKHLRERFKTKGFHTVFPFGETVLL